MDRIVVYLRLAILLSALGAPAWIQAQENRAAGPQAARLAGQTFEGQPFDLASLRGKVVLVVFWSTSCAVCRDKMGELRANYEGWRGQPFELVLVSQDRRFQDVQAYEQILLQTIPRAQRFPQLWSGQAAYKDSFGAQPMLPATFLINKNGQVEKSYIGRIPPQAWDDIAELL
jgi:peroxiredoxin